MATEVGVCNMALSLIGEDSITSIDPPEENERSRECAMHFASVRDIALYDIPMNFSIRRADLGAPLSDSPAFGFTYAYELPADPFCLRVLDTNHGQRERFVVEGRNLLINRETCKIRYIARVRDASTWDPGFEHSLAIFLASRICFKLTQNESQARGLLQQYMTVKHDHAGSNAQEGFPYENAISELEASR